jgi:hypothetical protein
VAIRFVCRSAMFATILRFGAGLFYVMSLTHWSGNFRIIE